MRNKKGVQNSSSKLLFFYVFIPENNDFSKNLKILWTLPFYVVIKCQFEGFVGFF